MAVVDAFDAMTSDRPYHPAHSPERARDEILSLAGKQFDPRMVHAFQACWQRGELTGNP
jgi:HD-GYP domain-containing protein (c-di-GMP phosphodiesterase class II)